ncbi:Ail/Lom family outer membrane beta-barrel protein [Salmonella enterica subsp. enterica serovar Benin]|nr:Ail/Lom family outer membrane beta-barrel protein [Salmonella enterica]ELD8107731.1 Ail/Lom family outer membrane beta-barrel protein [Salmonella enterica subsp. enterica serovar Benin]ELD9381934.1 Ail/Lom family outer membrane beta-barrel protein [Salmonella enterica subsp. enterica serovar Benin]HAF1611031.1 Ail/Lom family outer membrane beta-barrel protein [Salmonella enterica]
MNKITVAVLACLAVGSIGVANASQTVSVGYAQTEVNVTHSNQMPGFNVKYHWEDDNSGAGVIGSFAYTTKNDSNDYSSGKLTYYSVTAGPSYRFNDYVNIYALLGLAYGKIEEENAYLRYWESSTAFAYGAGVQFNPIENVAIDASYVYTQFSGDNDNVGAGTWMLGVGYRF